MKKLNPTYLSITALALAVIAVIMCVLCCTKQKSGSSVEEVLQNNPEIIVNAMQNYEQKMRDQQMAQAQKALSENIKDIESATAGVVANPNGEIILVEFFDFSCGYCHKIYPVLKNIAAKNPNVKIIARELTFLGPISQYAAKAALAAKEQGKYAEVYGSMMEYVGSLSENKIDELAVLAGVDLEKMKADMNSAKIEAQLKATNELAGKIQVNGVPTLILNGKLLQTLDESVIQSAIDANK